MNEIHSKTCGGNATAGKKERAFNSPGETSGPRLIDIPLAVFGAVHVLMEAYPALAK
jgi:hypothetical protein